MADIIQDGSNGPAHGEGFMTSDAGRPGRRQSELHDRGPARTDRRRRLPPVRKDGALQPRAHPRARRPCQGIGRLRHLHLYQPRHGEVHHSQALRIEGQENTAAGALFHGRWRKRFSRFRARPARLLDQVLYRGRELGHGRQQHARLLRARPAEVLRLHSHPEARPGDQPEIAAHDVGLLVALAGEPAPGHDPDVRPRHARRLSPHERIQLAHLLADQREERALLLQVALQDQAGNQELHRRRGRPDARQGYGPLAARPLHRDREEATFPSGASRSRL